MKNELIFDIDGTLWNSCPTLAKGWNNALKNLGLSERVTAKEIESVAGVPYKKCVDILLPELRSKYVSLFETIDLHEKLALESEGGVFYEGVLDRMQELSNDFNIFLISNCRDWYLELFLKFSQFKKFLYDYDCKGLSKSPKNEMIVNMIKKHSLIKPIYIGDTSEDEKLSKLAGVDFAHASYGLGVSENPDLIFSSFNKIVDYFKKNIS